RQRLLMVRGSTDYLADTKVSSDNNLMVFLHHFSSRTKIFRDGDPVEFVKELHRRWLEQYGTAETQVAEPIQARSRRPEMEPGAVCLSYASEDRNAVATIKDALEAAGVDVFFDKVDLSAGDDFEEKIKRCIGDCSLFIPVISQNTLTERRRFFRIEWNHAIEEAFKVSPGERFILPVVVDNTPPTSSAVPETFRKLHWEPLPNGQTNPNFVTLVKHWFRKYQKPMVEALGAKRLPFTRP